MKNYSVSIHNALLMRQIAENVEIREGMELETIKLDGGWGMVLYRPFNSLAGFDLDLIHCRGLEIVPVSGEERVILKKA